MSSGQTDFTSKQMLLMALLGTLLFDGVGHLLAGYTRRGLLWTGAAIVVLSCFFSVLVLNGSISFGLAAGIVLVRIACLVDAANCGRRPLRAWKNENWFALKIAAAAIATGMLPLVAIFLLRVFVIGTYVIPTNSMMPCLIGESIWGTCPQCQMATAFRYSFRGNQFLDLAEPVATCVHCGSRITVADYPKEPYQHRSQDRILVNKLLVPRRWDVIVFKFPEQPQTTYVFRLLGLPGEKVCLRDGELFINDKLVPKPVELKHLRYDLPPGVPFTAVGVDDIPAQLHDNEHFVVGDFSTHSYDSRLWKKGAPGYSKFAVPTDHLIGVVTHVYWPPDRCQSLKRHPPK